MSDTVPENCPGGPGSEMAGKASACDGCPSRQLCESAPKGPDPDIAIIAQNLNKVRRKILILSGKGGVGKSTTTALMARAVAEDMNDDVGILDIDITGPSQTLFMGVKGEDVHKSATGWEPIWASENICIMSAGALIGDGEALIWKGDRKTGLLKNFLKEVEWGKLDWLFIDSPPGTSDEHMSLVSLLKDSGIDGGIIVTTPSEVALLDVQRQIQFCQKVELPVIGVVENMAGFTCPKCSVNSPIFKPTGSGVAGLCTKNNLNLLGSLPIDPKICRAMDEGTDPMEIESTVIDELRNLKGRLDQYFES